VAAGNYIAPTIDAGGVVWTIRGTYERNASLHRHDELATRVVAGSVSVPKLVAYGRSTLVLCSSPAGPRPSTAKGRAQWRDPGSERPGELPGSELPGSQYVHAPLQSALLLLIH
jgi:hypothetical protein